MSPPPRSRWKLAAALIALGMVPAIAGGLRLAQLASGGPVTPANARFVATPLPVVLHIGAATTYCLIGAWQFCSQPRVGRSAWHRAAGRLLVACGLLAAGSGVWMTLRYPIAPALQGEWLRVVRLAVGCAMALAIVTATWRILVRDVAGHRAWMIRGYALGQGAGTQVLIFAGWAAAVGGPTPSGRLRDILMSAAWLVNATAAEWVVRRSTRRAARRPA